jgi:hypothetical protein
MPKRGLGYPIQDPYPVNSIEKRQVPGLMDASKAKPKPHKKVPNPNLTPMVMSKK